MNLLKSSNIEVVGQSIWMLGNIIGDCNEYRDLTISHGIIDQLLSFVRVGLPITFQRNLVWVFANLVRFFNSPVSFDVAQKLVPELSKFLTFRDGETKLFALYALKSIANCGDDFIQIIIDCNIISLVIRFISNNRYKIQLEALRLLTNVATGSDCQTQLLLDSGILEDFEIVLMHHVRAIRRSALRCLSNVIVGTQLEAQWFNFVILLPFIAENLLHDDDRVVKEATHVMLYLIERSNGRVIDSIDIRMLHDLSQLMHSHDADVVCASKRALKVYFRKKGFFKV